MLFINCDIQAIPLFFSLSLLLSPTHRLVGVAGTAVNSIGLAGNLLSLLLLNYHRPKSPTLSLLFTLTALDMFILGTNQYFYNIPSLVKVSVIV